MKPRRELTLPRNNTSEDYYLEHIFEAPKNLEMKVWRYMDFAKFISMLSSSSLYFTMFDRFEDTLEGLLPIKNREAIIGDNDSALYENMFKSITDWQQCHFFNCWHISEYETASMWTSYTDKKYGIAIQSTYQLLDQEFQNNKNIRIGCVQYLDKYNEVIKNRDDQIDSIHLYYPLFTKHIVYSSENELRLMYKKLESADLMKTGKLFQSTIEHGKPIKVNLEKIIEKVVISPYSDSFFKLIVEDILKKYEYNFSVIESAIPIR